MAAPGATVEEQEAQWRGDVVKLLEAQNVLLAQLVDLLNGVRVGLEAAAEEDEVPVVVKRKKRGG